MYCWDTNSILFSIKIVETNKLHKEKSSIYLENVINELTDNKETNLNRFKKELKEINETFDLRLDISTIRNEYDKILGQIKVCQDDLKEGIQKTKQELAEIKEVKYPSDTGDFHIIAYSKINKEHTVITHDLKLSCYIIHDVLSIFLIEYIIRENISINRKKLNYLWSLLEPYNIGLKKLLQKHGDYGQAIHRKIIEIHKFIEKSNPLSGQVIMPK